MPGTFKDAEQAALWRAPALSTKTVAEVAKEIESADIDEEEALFVFASILEAKRSEGGNRRRTWSEGRELKSVNLIPDRFVPVMYRDEL